MIRTMKLFAIFMLSIHAILSYAQNDNQDIRLVIQDGHKRSVLDVAISPDGNLILTGSGDGTAILWRADGIKLCQVRPPDQDAITKVAFLSGNHTFVTLDGNGIKEWGFSGNLVRTFDPVEDVGAHLAISADGNCVAAAARHLAVWNRQGALIGQYYQDYNYSFENIVFDRDNKIYAQTEFEDVETGHEEIRFIRLNRQGQVEKVLGRLPMDGLEDLMGWSSAISPDGKYVATGHQGKVLLRDFKGKIVRTIKFDLRSVLYQDMTFDTDTGYEEYAEPRSITFSPDGKMLYFYAGGVFVQADLKGNIVNMASGGGQKLTFTPDGKRLAAVRSDDIMILESSGEQLHRFPAKRGKDINRIVVSSDGSYFVTSTEKSDVEGCLSLWHQDGRLLDTDMRHVSSLSRLNDDNRFVTYSGIYGEKELLFWRINKDRLLLEKSVKMEDTDSSPHVALSPDGRVAVVGVKQRLEFWDRDGNLIRTVDDLKDPVYDITFNHDGNYLIVATRWFWEQGEEEPDCLLIYSFEGVLIREIAMKNRLSIIHGAVFRSILDVSPDNRIVMATQHGYDIWDINGNLLSSVLLSKDDVIANVAFSPDYRTIAALGDSYTIYIRTLDGQPVNTFRVENTWGGSSALAFHPGGRHILTGALDGAMRIWNIEQGDHVICMNEGSEWLYMTPDGYFDASRNGGSQVAMVQGTTPYAIDQFAMRTNRPDLILQRCGLADQETQAYLHTQYQKRLKRFGLNESDLGDIWQVPEVQLLSAEQDGKFLDLNFEVSEAHTRLSRYNIYINDVPVFGGYGKSIQGKRQTLQERVELTSGTNKIEITCFNTAGGESFRTITYATCQDDIQPDLYYLGFGVSQYQNPDLNLSYAHKDALDLANTFQGLSDQFGNVHIKTFTNEQVTIENIRQAKSFLADAKVDDIFVLFIAGHGVYSTGQDATYYYLTYNTDLANLSGTAADFDLIENLLQGIKPRKKLFLMDTCESGEIDEETQSTYYALADSRGIKARTSRAVILKERTEQPKRSYLYQKDRYIYNDLIRRSGAIVFSSSKGGEFSYESDVVQNGLFTEEILKCLTEGAGDNDGNGIVSTDELRNYVTKAVAAATEDAQHPTVDRDNIYQKFGFPVKK